MSIPIIFPTTYPVTSHTDFVGVGSTFVAIEGFKQNGSRYITHAIEKGATTIVVAPHALDPSVEKKYTENGIKFIYSDNPRRSLAHLSAQQAGYPAEKLRIIGVTGTKGKTTTVQLLAHILKQAGIATAYLSTVNNCIGTQKLVAPLTTAQPDYLHQFFKICVEQGIQYVIMEVAAQALSLERVAGITFEGIIWTNFDAAHGEFYQNVEDYYKAKCVLFSQKSPRGFTLINSDDHSGIKAVEQLKISNVYTYSLNNKHNSFYAHLIQEHPLLSLQVHAHHYTYNVHVPLMGKFNGYNCLAAIAAAHLIGVDEKIITESALSFQGIPGRLEKIMLPQGAQCFIDYAHNMSSFKAILEFLRTLTQHLIVVFGSGGERDSRERPLKGELVAQYADVIVITSDNPRSEDPYSIMEDIAKGIKRWNGTLICQVDRTKAIKCACTLASKDSIVVILGRGHEQFQKVGTQQIRLQDKEVVLQLYAHSI